MAYYGLQPLSNNSTIFVAPAGHRRRLGQHRGRDLTLFDDLVRLIEGDLCVDTTQLYALGWSYGGSDELRGRLCPTDGRSVRSRCSPAPT